VLSQYSNRCHIHLDPDSKFIFDEDSIEKIRGLLIGLNHESFVSSEVSQLGIFDVFTNIIIEALQYLQFIPYSVENEIEDIEIRLSELQ
jgi:hypothetical protein